MSRLSRATCGGTQARRRLVTNPVASYPLSAPCVNRLFIEAVLWIVRTGSPWRDLPAMFGNWNTTFRRFSDWRRADVFVKLFEACSDEPDMEYAMVDV